MKQNLVKFNNFVREKQGKVEGGLARVATEVEAQQKKIEELEELDESKSVNEEAKEALRKAVEGRRIPRNGM